MEKLYDRIDWHNNTSPALNETNLNRMSKAVDDIDDRVVDIAGTVMETVPQIQEDLAEAQELIEDAEELTTHPPIIGQNGHWWTWDTSIDDYADSGIDAGVSLTIGETTTLPAGSDATVTNTGTATDPVLNFGIPQGEAGQTGAGVPTGGTTGQVLKKKSGTNYDTEWGDDSAGHTILNSSGTAMTQRGKLQFVGADVTDDPANDKTIVTGTPQSMIGDAWASGQAYTVGDYRIDGNVLYKCKTAHTSSASNRPPYESYWKATSVSKELGGITLQGLGLYTNYWTYNYCDVIRQGNVITISGKITAKSSLGAGSMILAKLPKLATSISDLFLVMVSACTNSSDTTYPIGIYNASNAPTYGEGGAIQVNKAVSSGVALLFTFSYVTKQ